MAQRSIVVGSLTVSCAQDCHGSYLGYLSKYDRDVVGQDVGSDAFTKAYAISIYEATYRLHPYTIEGIGRVSTVVFMEVELSE